MRNVCTNILSAVDTASQNGNVIDANQLISGSFMAYFGDITATGTFKIQASNDPCASGGPTANLFVPVNWVDIPSASVAVASGASVLITIAQMNYRWIRAVYTRSAGGSSTVNVNMNALSV